MTTATPAPRSTAPDTVERRGDKTFSRLAVGAGTAILIALAAVAVFLIAQSLPALVAPAGSFRGTEGNFWEYVAPLAFGTVWAAAIALVIAVPIAVGIALFISHYAPRRLAQPLGYIIDLLAAVPSVVYGLWGITVLAPATVPLYEWLAENAGWFPLFAGPASGTGRTVLTVAIVLAVMVLPIITALCREVFVQTPTLNQEAAYALGATWWEMVRMAVFPYARSGIISAAMLGLGRALGETMAVAMVLSPSAIISFAVIQSENPSTIAANIALNFPESAGIQVNALIATGLVLFVITLIVNSLARYIVTRHERSLESR